MNFSTQEEMGARKNDFEGNPLKSLLFRRFVTESI